MAVSAVVAAISTATAAIGGTLFFGSIAAHFLITTAMGAALNALTPKPKAPGAAGAQGFNLRGESGAALDHQIIYGEARVGGARIYDASTGENNKYLHRILAFAGHEVDSYQEIYLNDEVLTIGNITKYQYSVSIAFDTTNGEGEISGSSTVNLTTGFIDADLEVGLVESGVAFIKNTLELTNSQYSSFNRVNEVTTILSKSQSTQSSVVTAPEKYVGKVRIKTYFGTTTQTADADLVSETSGLTDGAWTTDHRLQGIAYIYVRFEYNEDSFPNGIPSLSAKIRGKKVFDPRTGTTAWSDNPALCIRDYLTSEYGLNQISDRIDDALVINAANVCDQTVEGERRYTCNGAFLTGVEPSSVVTDLLTSMGGLLWYGQGKWRMKPAAWSTPTVTFDEGDLRSGISLSTRHSRRDNFNAVKGTFSGDATDWQSTDYPEVTDPAFLIADNNVPNVLDFPLPFTSSSLTAQRVARIALNRNREQLTFSASFGMRAFQVQVGDFVYITNTRFGWTNKAFEIVEWNFGLTDGLDLQINMTLREISEGVFTGVDGSVFELNNTTLPSAFTGLEITGLTGLGGGQTQGDGTFINSTLLVWNPVTNPFVSHYEIEWKPVADSNYASTVTKEISIEISPIIDGIEYIYRVRAVTALGNKGPFAGIEFTSGGDVTAPNPPTNVVAEAGYKYLAVNFDLPTAVDFNRVEVYESADSNFGNASSIGFTSGNRFIRTGLGNNVTRYYWVRSQDFSGNSSAFVGPVNATTFLVAETDLTAELIATIEAAGVEAVNSLPASGDFDGQIVFLLTDNTLYRWETSTSSWTTNLFTGIKDGSITETSIADNAISTPKLQANSVTATVINTDAVTTNKIAAGAIVTNKIAAGAVTADKITVSELSAITGVIGTFSSANTGERVVITDDKIEVYDASNVLRVRIGNLA